MERYCRNCIHSFRQSELSDPTLLFCYRREKIKDGRQFWPRVSHEHWCNEHETWADVEGNEWEL